MQTQIPFEGPKTFPVLGSPMHLLKDYPGWLANCAHQRQGCHVVTLNAEMAMQAEQDSRLSRIIRRADLVIPDGSGVVFYLKLHGHSVQRCPGIELAEKLLHEFGLNPTLGSVFFYGGQPGVAQSAADAWKRRLPKLLFAGVQHGYLLPDDVPEFHKTLQEKQPQLILVGLGVPRQEFWIEEHRHLCPNTIWIGVGGSFDIWSGTKTRAPEFFRKHHLEWLYRLYQEPWRWRRMLALPKFAWKAILYRFSKQLA